MDTRDLKKRLRAIAESPPPPGLRARLEHGIPAFAGTMIGHIDAQFTIPLGIEVAIDADAGTIELREPGVI